MAQSYRMNDMENGPILENEWQSHRMNDMHINCITYKNFKEKPRILEHQWFGQGMNDNPLQHHLFMEELKCERSFGKKWNTHTM